MRLCFRQPVGDLGAVDVAQVGLREVLGELPSEGVLVGGDDHLGRAA